MKTLYTAEATTSGGREGRVKSSDGRLEIALAKPKEMGGGGGPGTNPEQLFAAGYAACFESAMRLVASKQKMTLQDTEVTAKVALRTEGETRFSLAVELAAKVGGLSAGEVESLMHAAHEVCPYSNATRGNVDVKLSART